MDRDGEVVVALDEAAVAQAARELHSAGVEAIAICFLWAVRNDAHERRAREIVEGNGPRRVCLDVRRALDGRW